MNEILFFIHVAWVSGLAFYCRKRSVTTQSILMVMYAVLGNLMVFKQMSLFGMNVTTSDVYAVGVILVLNYIREEYDDKAVYKAMGYSFAALFMLALAAFFQNSYIPVVMDDMTQAYIQLMSPFPRMVMVSALVYLFVQYIDNILFSWLKKLCMDRYFIARVSISLVFSQVLDTFLFTLFGLYPFGHLISFWDVVIFSSIVKITCSTFVVIETEIFIILSRIFGSKD